FTNASPRGIRVLANLFGTEERVAAAIGADSREALTELGKLLAALRAPQPPRSIAEAWRSLPLLKEILNMAPRKRSDAPWHEEVLEGDAVDLSAWPIQTCWPDDDARAAARPPELRDLSAAGHRPQPGHHALAPAPRRRHGLSRVPRKEPA